MHGQEQEPMLPWWQGFRGEIKEVEKHKFEVTGVAEKTGPTSVGVTELPIHKWTQNFKNDLESMVTGEKSGRASIKVCICLLSSINDKADNVCIRRIIANITTTPTFTLPSK